MKPGSFTQLYVQIVFAVKNREALLHKNFRSRVFGYMSGTLCEMKHKVIIVNGVSNHVHILIGLNPSISISDTVHDVKRSTSLFINKERFCRGKFAWQEGYGAFTYSRSQIDKVYKYILNQEEHHKNRGFKEEYTEFLEKYDIEYNEKYLFDFLEEV